MSPSTSTATSPVAPPEVAGACLRSHDGTVIPLDVNSWSAEADAVEHRLLATVVGPALDLGCGPGRLVVALAERGIPALGVDASPAAVSRAMERQATALVRSVFDPLPGTGRWRTALLLDGNVGIGGDPVHLLTRVAELLARDGRALVETGPPGTGTRSFPARLERGDECTDWFPWAQVDTDGIGEIAYDAGLSLTDLTTDDGRWFAELTPVGGR